MEGRRRTGSGTRTSAPGRLPHRSRPATRRVFGVRLALPAALAAVTFGVFSPPALAYWSAQGEGGGEAFVTTLITPTLAATGGVEGAELRWSEVTPPSGSAAEVTYYVTRNGGPPSAGCPSQAHPSHVLACTDTGLAGGGSYTYTVTGVWRSWAGQSEAQTVTVGASTVTHFRLEAAKSTVSAGEADSLTITAEDAAGGTVHSFTGSHLLTFSGAAPAPSGAAPTVTSSAGIAKAFGEATAIDFSEGKAVVSGAANGAMVLYRAEVAHILVSEGPIGSEPALPVTVTAGAFRSFSVTPLPAQPEAGAPFEVRLAAWDEWHNTITTYTRTRALRYEGAEPSPSGAAPEYASEAQPAFTAGEATVKSFRFYKAASTTLNVTEEGTGHAGAGTFTVAPGSARSLALAAAASEVPVGQPDNLTVTALDGFGNVATSYGGAAGEVESLTFTGAQPGPNGTAPTVSSEAGVPKRFGEATPIRFEEGLATVSGAANGVMTLYKVQQALIKVSAGTLNNGAGLAITVKPGAATSFTLTGLTPAEPQAGQALSVTLTALDAGGNVATGFGGAAGEVKTISWSGPESSPSGAAPAYPASATSVTFKEGAGTATGITLYRAGATTLTATSGAASGSAAFTVLAGPAARLTWWEPQISAGTMSSPCDTECLVEGLGSLGTFSSKVSIADQWGNPQTSHRNAIEVRLTARRLRGFGFGGGLDRNAVTIPAGSAISQAFTFTAPRLIEFGGRRFRRRFSSYTYRLTATAQGYQRANAAKATLKS
jgi:hypothetical protein